MAIKTSSQGSIPAIDLNYIQYSQFRMSVQEQEPHKIAVSAVLRPYGVSNGEKFYAKDTTDMQIANLDQFIANLPPEKQVEAAVAMQKVQEGLGVLAATYLDVDFIEVE